MTKSDRSEEFLEPLGFVWDVNALVMYIEERWRKEQESKPINLKTKHSAALNKCPAPWINGICQQLGLPTRGKARPRAFYRGEGCEHCFHTGYYGRTGIFEVMPMSEEIKDLVFRETTKEVLAQVARDLGMQTLRQSGLNRVLDGTTTVEEFFRVIWT